MPQTFFALKTRRIVKLFYFTRLGVSENLKKKREQAFFGPVTGIYIKCICILLILFIFSTVLLLIFRLRKAVSLYTVGTYLMIFRSALCVIILSHRQVKRMKKLIIFLILYKISLHGSIFARLLRCSSLHRILNCEKLNFCKFSQL